MFPDSGIHSLRRGRWYPGCHRGQHQDRNEEVERADPEEGGCVAALVEATHRRHGPDR